MILGILGSAAKDSVSREILLRAGERLTRGGSRFRLVDLAVEFPEAHRLEEYDEPPPGSQTAQLRALAARCEAAVLATPVYHGSYSALLKNALDHLTGDALAGRPVGLVAAGGGPRGAGTACDQLRTVVRALGGWAAPTHVATTAADLVPGPALDFLDARLDALAAELLSFPARAPDSS
ncbi:NADPH-dependent FMN reductase [Streptomyces sp. NPDC058783]|uniref:NADPH-dependent FMN reductase n=1 Tax=Streptomyces TaxID=1883 RepID=UPI00210E761D|nr:NADPH-dependent FMN reductase [Streptomyces coelicoflavus]MCQ4205403.1 NAD(P)H-dependent oxidoreductase [Streptomyces coelicoflavus]